MRIVLKILCLVVLLNIVTTTIIDQYKHKDYGQMHLFERLPQVFLWNFKSDL